MKYLMLGAAVAAAVVAAAPAFAQNADREMRRTVREACKNLGSEVFEDPKTLVDPTGSASYAMAIVRGVSFDTGERERAICVYNKATGEAELGAFLRKGKKNQKKKAGAQGGQPMDGDSDDDQF